MPSARLVIRSLDATDWSSRTAAARSWPPKTHWPPSHAAWRRAADGIECDVHLSRDGVPVVIHDATLDRTTDASGPVSARTADELARVDAGFRFQRRRRVSVPRPGHRRAALEQVLNAVRSGRIIIEMKQGLPELARAVIDVVRRAGVVDRVCVGSFYRAGLEVMRRGCAGDRDQRVGGGSALDAVSIVDPLAACGTAALRGVPGAAARRPAHGRLARLSRAGAPDEARRHVWVVDEPSDIIRF